jgi:hypothetical protein
MRLQSHHHHAIARGIIVPASEIETFLACGFRLGDEPGCGIARMFSIVGGLNCVPINPTKLPAGAKKLPAAMASRTGKKDCDNGIVKARTKRTQGR